MTQTVASTHATEEKVPTWPIYLICSLVIALFAGLIVGHIYTSDWSIMTLFCSPVFVSLEIVLTLSFIALTAVALKKYLNTREFWTTEAEDKLEKDDGIFDQLAQRHKQLSQLWFTISLAMLCGGLMYAAFHVMNVPCYDLWQLGKTDNNVEGNNENVWSDLVHFIPNLFLYSLFFVGYTWSLKNYKAHWHNFVTNEHRYASLIAIKQIREGNSESEIKNQLDMQSAVVVLLPSETAYLENEGEGEITAAERLLKIEEAIRELATQGRKGVKVIVLVSKFRVPMPHAIRRCLSGRMSERTDEGDGNGSLYCPSAIVALAWSGVVWRGLTTAGGALHGHVSVVRGRGVRQPIRPGWSSKSGQGMLSVMVRSSQDSRGRGTARRCDTRPTPMR